MIGNEARNVWTALTDNEKNENEELPKQMHSTTIGINEKQRNVKH